MQIACIYWFKLQYPNKLIASVPNGGSRNIIEAARMKREGTLSGLPDIVILEPCGMFNACFIELKAPKGKHSANQIEVMGKLLARGYSVNTCYSFDDFKKVVEKYFSLDNAEIFQGTKSELQNLSIIKESF